MPISRKKRKLLLLIQQTSRLSSVYDAGIESIEFVFPPEIVQSEDPPTEESINEEDLDEAVVTLVNDLVDRLP